MILRLPNPATRGFLVLLAGLLAIALSFFSIRAAMATHAAELGTLQGFQRATRLEPGNARNWDLLGRYWQYDFENTDSQRAIRAYQISLSLNPDSADTLLDLGTAYELEGDLSRARDAFVRAKRVYPASADVSWRYGNFLLRQGELQPAFTEIRRAVQADPRRGAEAFSRCYRAISDMDLILDQVLPALPEVYVAIIWDLTNDHQTDLAMKVWLRLVALHPHLAIRDIYPLIGALLEKREYAEARRVWDQGVSFSDLPRLDQPPGSVIWDGGFESGVNGSGFAWRFPLLSLGVQTSLDSREHHSGRNSLRLAFDGKHNPNFESACTTAVVQPDTSYLFSAWVHTKALTSDQGIRFRLRSPEIAGSLPVSSSEVHGSEPWMRIEMPWTAGAGVHLAQICICRDPSDRLDNRIQGTAWVDDLALVPQTKGTPKP